MSAARHATAPLTLLLAAAVAAPARAQDAGPPVSVALDVGAVAAVGSQSDNADAVPARVAWLAGVTARTPPAAIGRNWHFSAAFALRREPAFGIARTSAAVAPAYFDSVSLSSSIEFAHASGPLETAIVGRFAETRFDAAQPAARAANTIGDWAFLVDAVAELRWHVGRAPRRSTDPATNAWIRVYAGVQHNQRLHRDSDLQPFDDPTGRIVGGVFVTPWRWRNARGESVTTAGGGVDMETAIRAGERLPAGFRALVRTVVDLRALR